MKKRIFFAAIALLSGLCPAHALDESNLVIADATAEAGTTVTIPVTMTGCASGYQFEVYPPAGVTLTKVQRGEVIKVRDDDDEYIFTFQNAGRENGGRFVLCYSIGVLTEQAGEVAKLVFSVDESVAPGTYNIEMKNAECAHSTYILSTYRERTSTLTVTNPSAVNGITAGLLSGPVTVYNTAGVKVKAIGRCTSSEEITAGLAPGTYTVKGNGLTVKIVKP